MDKKVTVEKIVSGLCTVLGVNQKQLARMLQIDEASISNKLSKSIQEIRTKKTGKRLLPLFLIVTDLDAKSFSREAIIEGINEPVIPNFAEDRKESVLQAIQLGSLTNVSVLTEKAVEGVKSFSDKKLRLKKRIFKAVESVYQTY